MSAEAMSWAWRQRDLPPRTKFVLVALADGAGFYGFCRPSLEALSAKTNLDEPEVEDALELFIRIGILEETPYSRSGYPFRITCCDLPFHEMSKEEKEARRQMRKAA